MIFCNLEENGGNKMSVFDKLFGMKDLDKRVKKMNAAAAKKGSGKHSPLPEGVYVVNFELSVNNCSAELEVYLGEMNEEGGKVVSLVRRSRYGENGYIDEDKPFGKISGGSEFTKKMAKLFSDCNVYGWDGFHGANPPGVLDGTSMSFKAEFSDGSRVSASGSNNFPAGYHVLKNALAEMTTRGILEKAELEYGGIVLKLPDEWAGNTRFSFSSDIAVVEVVEGKDSVALIRLEISESGYRDDSENVRYRLGRLIKDGEEFFVSLYLYGPMDSGYLSAKNKNIFKDEKLDILKAAFEGDSRDVIAQTVSAVEGEWFAEKGDTLYYSDGRALFDKSRSIILSLFAGGDYPSGRLVLEKDGKKYISYSCTYDRDRLRTLDDLKCRMHKYFTEELTGRIIACAEKTGGFIEENGYLYVPYEKTPSDSPYGNSQLKEVKNDHLIVSVRKKAEGDGKYDYSSAEIFEFPITRNEEGRFVFSDFYGWDANQKTTL